MSLTLTGLLNLWPPFDYRTASETAPSVQGIERTAPDNRLHSRAPDNRLHATADDNRLHVRAKESGH